MRSASKSKTYRVLSLDGGGAKGLYTLGVLKGIEAAGKRPIHEQFDLIFGTSTGAIIATLLALGRSVDDIARLYRTHVVRVMAQMLPGNKSLALEELSKEVFDQATIADLKTSLSVVCTNWDNERPMIFKSDDRRAFHGKDAFVPFFGVSLGDAVQASCSAYPFFRRKRIKMNEGDTVLLVDGGYCANNPTLYAIADATDAMRLPRESIRVVSIGVGEYPVPKKSLLNPMRWLKYLITVRLLQKTLEINTQSMDQLRRLLFQDIPTVRISKAYTQPEMATDMFEHDMAKLDLLWRRGRESYLEYEDQLAELFNRRR